MLIRKEEAKDYESIYSVVKNAFDNAEYSDGNEQDLVNALREGTAFIPELSLVLKWMEKYWDILYLRKRQWIIVRSWY